MASNMCVCVLEFLITQIVSLITNVMSGTILEIDLYNPSVI